MGDRPIKKERMDYIEKGAGNPRPIKRRLRLRCFGCGRWWGRQFGRCGRALRRRFRGGRNG